MANLRYPMFAGAFAQPSGRSIAGDEVPCIGHWASCVVLMEEPNLGNDWNCDSPKSNRHQSTAKGPLQPVGLACDDNHSSMVVAERFALHEASFSESAKTVQVYSPRFAWGAAHTTSFLVQPL